MSAGRTYPHQKFDDEEAQENERNQWTGIGAGRIEYTIGRSFKTKFEKPNENSENIVITDRTSAICKTEDMIASTLEADFKKE